MANKQKVWADGDILTASDLNSYLMNQSVIVCDSSASYPTSPVEGMVIYDKALGAYLGRGPSSWIQIVGATGDSGGTWTPQLYQGSFVTSSYYANLNYYRNGPVVDVWVNITPTATGTSGSVVEVTLPVAAASRHRAASPDWDVVGHGVIQRDTGTAKEILPCAVVLSPSRSRVGFQVYRALGASIAFERYGSQPSVAVGTSDNIRFHARYWVS